MISCHGNKKFLVNKISKDKDGRILIIEAQIETETIILLNYLILYYSIILFKPRNLESEQLQALNDADLLLSDFPLGAI